MPKTEISNDLLTANIKRATDALLARNPVGTSQGLLFGVILYGLVSAFTPWLQSQIGTGVLNLSALGWWFYLAIGVLLFNLSQLFERKKLPPKIKEILDSIEEGKRNGTINENQAKLLYRAAIVKVVEQITVAPGTQEELKAVAEKAVA